MASDVVVSGNAAASELINRINSTDPAFMMPPPEQADRLSTEEKALLENWVNEGAEWEKHWSFIKPRKVDLPQPEGVSSWARNPIDYFVFARFQRMAGLALVENPLAFVGVGCSGRSGGKRNYYKGGRNAGFLHEIPRPDHSGSSESTHMGVARERQDETTHAAIYRRYRN